MRSQPISVLDEQKSQLYRSPSVRKDNKLLNKTEDNSYDKNLTLAQPTPPQSIDAALKDILQKVFKNNHHEDLELSSLTFAQRNYLKKIINKDQAKLPFKMPHRDEDSDQRV